VGPLHFFNLPACKIRKNTFESAESEFLTLDSIDSGDSFVSPPHTPFGGRTGPAVHFMRLERGVGGQGLEERIGMACGAA